MLPSHSLPSNLSTSGTSPTTPTIPPATTFQKEIQTGLKTSITALSMAFRNAWTHFASLSTYLCDVAIWHFSGLYGGSARVWQGVTQKLGCRSRRESIGSTLFLTPISTPASSVFSFSTFATSTTTTTTTGTTPTNSKQKFRQLKLLPLHHRQPQRPHSSSNSVMDSMNPGPFLRKMISLTHLKLKRCSATVSGGGVDQGEEGDCETTNRSASQRDVMSSFNNNNRNSSLSSSSASSFSTDSAGTGSSSNNSARRASGAGVYPNADGHKSSIQMEHSATQLYSRKPSLISSHDDDEHVIISILPPTPKSSTFQQHFRNPFQNPIIAPSPPTFHPSTALTFSRSSPSFHPTSISNAHPNPPAASSSLYVNNTRADMDLGPLARQTQMQIERKMGVLIMKRQQSQEQEQLQREEEPSTPPIRRVPMTLGEFLRSRRTPTSATTPTPHTTVANTDKHYEHTRSGDSHSPEYIQRHQPTPPFQECQQYDPYNACHKDTFSNFKPLSVPPWHRLRRAKMVTASCEPLVSKTEAEEEEETGVEVEGSERGEKCEGILGESLGSLVSFLNLGSVESLEDLDSLESPI